MAYTQLDTRTTSNPNSAADVNQLQLNIEALKGGTPATAPTTTIEGLATSKQDAATAVTMAAAGGAGELLYTAAADRAAAKSGVVSANVVTNSTGNAAAIGNIIVAAGTDKTVKDSGIGIASGAAAGMVLISAQTANNSASIDFTLDTSLYGHFMLCGENIVPVSDGAGLFIRLSEAGVAGFDATSGHYGYEVWRYTSSANAVAGNYSTAAEFNILEGETLGTGANEICDFEIQISSAGNPRTRLRWHSNMLSSLSTYVTIQGSGVFLYGSSAKDAIQVVLSSGNISTGTFYLYGFRKT